MYLDELLEVLNDNAVITLYDASQIRIGVYDGKDTLDVVFTTYEDKEINVADFEVTDVFPDNYNKINCIGIEINIDIKEYKECIML